MYPRTNYEMTEEDLNELLEACKPVPAIMLHIGGGPSSPQERANAAWGRLGKKMGFDHMTVHPIIGKGSRFFTAVPSETEDQRQVREKAEAEKKRKDRMEVLTNEIRAKEAELRKLEEEA